MSQFIPNSTTSPSSTILWPNDIRLWARQFRPVRERINFDFDANFAGVWWPGSGLYGAANALLGSDESYEDPDLVSGKTTGYGFRGITRDVNGTPVGGVTIKLFRTSDDRKVGEVTSNTDGSFLVFTPYYPDMHYMLAFKDGVPEVAGVSSNNLVGE